MASANTHVVRLNMIDLAEEISEPGRALRAPMANPLQARSGGARER